MSRSNIVIYTEEELNIEKWRGVLSKFNAVDQLSNWGMERAGSWLWVNHYVLEHNEEIRDIWLDISRDSLADSKKRQMQTAIFVQPSRDRNAVFFALSFCKEIYAILDKRKEVCMYHAESGLFCNDQIENLTFLNTSQFYDKRQTNSETIHCMLQCLTEEFKAGIECIVEDGGWDGEEAQYADLFQNLLTMRAELEKEQNAGIVPTINEELKNVDKLILELMRLDQAKLLGDCT
ncbi:hypothetical protein [Paenibacillus sp. JJ-223]|uniref:hypothetical protein n=1 Tax=Paenibacillus sp. JJ-223 TaxID=2905647 RepID=UPI001F2232B0|nr:hypothetical protein [Paenibacillus sp. JJ-223]CAH1224493.1 hypothetical protein PAECIP111890_05676 [Paenibacillus sp. JJ-223]